MLLCMQWCVVRDAEQFRRGGAHHLSYWTVSSPVETALGSAGVGATGMGRGVAALLALPEGDFCGFRRFFCGLPALPAGCSDPD